MKIVLIIVGVLAALIIVLLIIGALRPKEHVASVTVTLARSDSAVFGVVSDFERVPEWNPAVKSVRRIEDVDGKPTYREKYDGGWEVTNVVRELVPNRKIVREILPGGGFSGSWTWELQPVGGETRLTITERGRVDSAIFRAFMMFSDNEKTMRGYVAALRKKLG